MNWLLIITTSYSSFLPNGFQMTPFSTQQECEVALEVAKTHWATVDSKSECVDLKKLRELDAARKKVKELLR